MSPQQLKLRLGDRDGKNRALAFYHTENRIWKILIAIIAATDMIISVEKFAIHVKGHELTAHNIQANPPRGLSYVTANRGACHLNGDNVATQNSRAMLDSTGLCSFPTRETALEEPMLSLLSAIVGQEYDKSEFVKTGERVFNLEKMLNYREGFRRVDDRLPDRFFEDAFSVGAKKGSVLDREQFEAASPSTIKTVDGIRKPQDRVNQS